MQALSGSIVFSNITILPPNTPVILWCPLRFPGPRPAPRQEPPDGSSFRVLLASRQRPPPLSFAAPGPVSSTDAVHFLPAAMSSRSRSTSLSSRGECKNCISKKEKWGGHLCLRHAPCMDPQVHLWLPDKCTSCITLFEDSASKDHHISHEARLILKEIMRSAEAVASRKDLLGFVTREVFTLRFQDWMGTFHSRKSVRPEPSGTTSSLPGREDKSSGSQTQPQVPSPHRTPVPSPSASKPASNPLASAASKAQIALTAPAVSLQGTHNPRSPWPSPSKPPTPSARSHCSPPSSRKASVTSLPHPSPRGRSRSPPHNPRKRPPHHPTHASPHTSSGEPCFKRSRHSHRRERSSSQSLHDEFKEFRKFREQQQRDRHARRRSRTPKGRRHAYRERPRSRGRSRRRRYSFSRSPVQRHSGSRSSSRSSQETSYRRGTPASSPPSRRHSSREDQHFSSSRSEATSRAVSPVTLPDPSTRTFDLFGSDSENALPPAQPRTHDVDTLRGPSHHTSPVHLTAPNPEEIQVKITPHSLGSEAMRPELTYYHLSSDAQLNEDGLTAPDLPQVPRRSLHLAKRNGRHVVAFLDAFEYPALEYISHFNKVGTRKDVSPSQRDHLRSLNRILQAGDQHHVGLSWHVQDHDSQDGEFEINLLEALEEYADEVSQPKGYGDETRRPPLQPHVPLRTRGPKLQRLIDFLEAGSLSPTSHHLRKSHQDGRTTREPPKAERDTDHEYRRAARSALGIKLAWHFLKDIARFPTLSSHNKVRTINSVLDVFQKDVDSTMDYQVTRAVHHRRNLIQLSTKDMPQADVRAALQDLPLPAGPTLFHESAAATIETTLQRPEGRQLAIIRDRPIRRPYQSSKGHSARFRKPSSSRQPTPPAPAAKQASSTAPHRKPTRPARPSSYMPRAPADQPKAGGAKPWKRGGSSNNYSRKQAKASSKSTNGSSTKKSATSTKL